MARSRPRLAAAACAALLLASAPVAADPPAWAPAHGWRDKQRHQEVAWLVPDVTLFGRCDRDVIGAIVGAVAGGGVGQTIGSGSGRIVATVTGALLGGLIGNAVGESLDQADLACFGEALERAPDHGTVAWANPNAGTSWQVTPQATWQDASGAYCREYQRTVTVGGQTQNAYGTACRQPDGSWRLVN